MRFRFRRFLQRTITRLQRWLTPPPDVGAPNRFLEARLNEEVATRQALERVAMNDAHERISELVEARKMAGSGPWTVSPEVARQTGQLIDVALESLRQPLDAAVYFESQALSLREATPAGAVGAYSDIELALQNVEWRREINLSWLEFSRWESSKSSSFVGCITSKIRSSSAASMCRLSTCLAGASKYQAPTKTRTTC